MKKNDVLRKGDLTLRILVIREACCLVINCDGNSMPVWMSADELTGCTNDPPPAFNTTMTQHQKQLAHERFTLIAPMLTFLTDDKERNRLMSITAKQHGISKQTLRRYLCRYLVYQDVAALAPAVREEKQELTQDQKNMRWALNKYFYSPKKSSLTEVYVKLLKERYCDADGRLLTEYPSMRQFRYFEQKHRNQENYLISRNGLKNYQRNDRPLLGEGVQQFAPYIGVGMLDATVCDIYLISKEGSVIGRPILVAGVDANTSLCLGYSLLWEGGVYSLQQLMLNFVSDKSALCRKMGIAIEERQWPSTALPGVTEQFSLHIKSTIYCALTSYRTAIYGMPKQRFQF